VNFGAHTATGTSSALHFDTVIGGTGADTLTGPAADTVWRIDDVNSGYLLNGDDSVLTFKGIENLTGAATVRDVFVVEKDGSISGTVTGSVAGRSGLLVQSDTDDTFSVVNPQPGITSQQMTLHTKTVTYAGLNPFVSPTATADATISGGEVETRWRLGDA